MRKTVLLIGTIIAISTLYAQILVDSYQTNISHQRIVSGIFAAVTPDGSLVFSANMSLVTLDGTNIVSSQLLKTISLSGTNLDSALLTNNLPNQSFIKTNFDALFQRAWTNSIINQ